MVSHKLKQDAVAETVRKWIMDGRYKEGDQLPPDTELSELFGMNKHTVAQGLNQLVSEDLLTRARMRGTIVKRTFTPPASDAVPLVSSSEGHFYSDMVKELNQCLLDQKLYPVLINNQMFYSKNIESFLDCVIDKNQPYGFLFVGEMNFPYDYIRQKQLRFNNSVFMFHYHYPEELPFCRYVLTDYDAMSRKAVEYFAERNVKRILYPAFCEPEYAGPYSSIQVRTMMSMKKYAAKLGLELDEQFFWRTHGGANMKDMLKQTLSIKSGSDGLFAFSDSFLFLDAVAALYKAGYDPDNFVMLAQYDTPLAEKYHFNSFNIQPLKTVHTALDMLTGKCTERKILIEPEIIIHEPQ